MPPPPESKTPFSERLGWHARAAWAGVRRGRPALLVYLITQTVVLVVLLPIISWLFREAIGVAGLRGLDQTTVGRVLASPVSVLLIVLMLVLAFVAVTVQLVLVAAAIRRSRLGAPVTPGVLLADLRGVLRRLAGPGSLPLVWYVFLVLPLGQAGFFSALTHGVAIPNFVSGELLKSWPGLIGYVLFLIVASLLNGRYALTLPLLVATDATGARAMRASARLMRRASLAFDVVVAVIVIAGLLAGALLVRVAVVPTWAVENLIGDGPAPVIASVSIGLAVLVGAVLSGWVVLAIGSAAFSLLERTTGQLRPRDRVTLLPVPAAESQAPRATPRARLVTAAVTLIALAGLAALAHPAMVRTADTPSTLILAHRGFSEDTPQVRGGVENTISGLEAAAAAGAEMVEMDVLQTSDHRFVVMHDPDLSRLAGQKRKVGEMTLDELTRVTVTDIDEHTDRIPSLADYVNRARELDMPLLIEIKLHGLETPDHVELLIAELEELDALERNIYHSLDAASVQTLKRLRPQLWVGFTMAVASATPPETDADFIVVEDFSLTTTLVNRAHEEGLQVFVWTVNTEQGLRNALRTGVDGIITDRPDLALPARASMGPDEPLSAKLGDNLRRFVTVL